MGLNPGEGCGTAWLPVHAKSYVPQTGSLETRPGEHGPPKMACRKCCGANHSYGHASFPLGPEVKLKIQLKTGSVLSQKDKRGKNGDVALPYKYPSEVSKFGFKSHLFMIWSRNMNLILCSSV